MLPAAALLRQLRVVFYKYSPSRASTARLLTVSVCCLWLTGDSTRDAQGRDMNTGPKWFGRGEFTLLATGNFFRRLFYWMDWKREKT